jgi:hypothetical protein
MMMPILTLTLDTEEQTMNIMVDGNPVDNVSEVNIYSYGYDADACLYFSVITTEKVGDVHKLTRFSAKEDPAIQPCIVSGEAKPSKTVAGLVEMPVQTKAQEQFADWFKSTRGR